LILIADGNCAFPVVMVGGVLEANTSWDIGKEVINCIHKHYPSAYPVRPKVRIPPFSPLVKSLLKNKLENVCPSFSHSFGKMGSTLIVGNY
jgi:hypothetical protein